jgi:curved DNA-binding protein
VARERTLELLGLPPTATTDEIKQRYRELARVFHPDVNASDPRASARFRAITAAYKELISGNEEPILLTTRKVTEPSDASGGLPTPGLEVVVLNVTLAQVITGSRVEVRFPDGATRQIDVPPGADTGTLLRHRANDALVEIRVAPDLRFRRQGADLLTSLSISVDAAARGTRVELAAPAGRVAVIVPQRSRHGDVVRILGHGVPSPKGRGDLYVELIP